MEDMKIINYIDKKMTTGMLVSEESIKFKSNSHPWSPRLIYSMLELHLWKIISSEFLNKSKIERSNMEIIKNNLRQEKTNLKNVQAQAKELRETHLQQSAEETEADENFIHARYLRNLICIENQQLMHMIIKSYSTANQNSTLI